jgi:hypothetical protein
MGDSGNMRRPPPGFRPPGLKPPSKPGTEHSWNLDTFWEDFPWQDVSFFSREVYFDWPAPAVLPIEIDRFTIPRGQVLCFTSVMFRVILGSGVNPPGPLGPPYLYAPDDLVLFTNTFEFLISGRRPVDRFMSVGGAEQSGYEWLNRNIATPGLPWRVYAKEGESVSTTFLRGALTFFPQAAYAGVEYEGIWLPISLWYKYRKEFTGGER